MARSVQDIRDYVRTYLELEQDDVSDLLIDSWITQGFNLIKKERRTWPGYEAEDTLQTEVGVQIYDKDAFAVDFREITAIEGLKLIDSTEAERIHTDRTRQGTPSYWSHYGGTVRLWPIPDSDEIVYNVRGYRNPERFENGTDVPDLPHADLEDALLAFVMAKAFLHQEDPELAGEFRFQFEEGLRQTTKDEFSAPNYGPVVMASRRTGNGLSGRLAYPWE